MAPEIPYPTPGDGFWVGLQTDYDTARVKDTLSDVLSRIHRFEPIHV